MKAKLNHIKAFSAITILCISALNSSAQQSDDVNEVRKTDIELTNVELLKFATHAPDRSQYSGQVEYNQAKREWIEKNTAAYERIGGNAADANIGNNESDLNEGNVKLPNMKDLSKLSDQEKRDWITKNPAAYKRMNREFTAAHMGSVAQ